MVAICFRHDGDQEFKLLLLAEGEQFQPEVVRYEGESMSDFMKRKDRLLRFSGENPPRNVCANGDAGTFRSVYPDGEICEFDAVVSRIGDLDVELLISPGTVKSYAPPKRHSKARSIYLTALR